MYAANYSRSTGTFLTITKNYVQAFLCLPFDVARENYSRAVNAGLIERSMLASAKFGRTLNHMETMALGPFARGR